MMKRKEPFRIRLESNIDSYSMRNEVLKAIKNTKYQKEGRFLGRQTKSEMAKTFTKDFDKSNNDNMIEKVMRFNKTLDENLDKYKFLKEENEHFSQTYNRGLTASDSNKKVNNPQIKKMTDLVTKYREKGYDLPELSEKKNLFKPSFLLLQNEKIEDYYKYVEYMQHMLKDDDDKQSFKKDSLYINTLDFNINYALQKDEIEKQKLLKTKQIVKKVILRNSTFRIKTDDEIEYENKNLKVQIQKMKKLIEQKETYKKLKIMRNMKDDNKLEENGINLSPDRIKIKNMSNLNVNSFNNNIGNRTASTNFESLHSKRSNFNVSQKSFTKQIERQNENIENLEDNNSEFIDKTSNSSGNLLSFKQNKNIKNNPNTINLENKTIGEILSPQKYNKKKTTEVFKGHLKSLSNTNLKMSNLKKAINSKKRNPIVENTENNTKEEEMRRRRDSKMESLNELYNKITKHDNPSLQEEIKYYLNEHRKNDYSILAESENVTPNDMLKFFNDLKNKIQMTDFNQTYRNFSLKFGGLKIDANELKNVKILDEKIFNLDKFLIKELMKIEKSEE